MRKVLTAAALAVLMMSTAASAADNIPPARSYTPYVAVSTVYNWTGFYAGINGGYSWGRGDSTAYFGGVPLASASGSSSGFVAGALAGYNWQGNSPLVLGIEADLNTVKDIPWTSSVRGRVGYAFDRWLPYVTGGAAWAKVNFDLPGTSWSETRFGWALGGGVEYAFNRNWRAGLEYRHTDFGTGETNAFAPVVIKTRFTSDAVLGRLIYRF